MNCTEVFNYIFESFNSNNIDYAIIHSYQYLPDRFDSDIDTAINVPNIKDAIKLLDDTLVGTGWRVIQFWRMKTMQQIVLFRMMMSFFKLIFAHIMREMVEL